MRQVLGEGGLNRRGLLLAGLSTAGGLAIGFPNEAEAQSGPIRILADGANAGPEMTAWLIIDPDDTVTIRIPQAEMGQGTATGLAMLAAEELECDWTKVRIEYASANRNFREKMVYKAMYTTGSNGTRSSVAMMQQAGASARERLRIAAANHWKVDPAECSITAGKCALKASNRTLGYGELAAAAAPVKLPVEPILKTPDQFTQIVGKWTPRIDTAAKLDGSAQFSLDVKVPGMVCAAISASPVFGGTLKSVDDSAIQGRRGIIQVVKLKDAVAVVADRYWRAKAALADLKIEWDPGKLGSIDSAQLDKDYRDALDGPMVQAEKIGDAGAVLAAPGAKLVTAEYEVPYLAHATMEPLNCTVKLEADRCDIWIGSQGPMLLLQLAAKATGLPQEAIYVHNQFMGGGFGRKSEPDEAMQAIAIAKAVGKPVKLIWSREQDVLRDRFRPQAAVRFTAALGDDGKVLATDAKIVVASVNRSLGRNPVANGVERQAVECISESPYGVPNKSVGLMLKNVHVPVMFWRSVGGSQNGFFYESFIDELAHAAGADPYRFRREMLERPDLVKVLDTVAEKSGWGTPLPKGRGRGIAIVDFYGSVTAHVVEVTVTRKGELTVDRVTVAFDCYNAVNPNTIDQQISGGVIFGDSAARYGEITIKDGAAEQTNFDRYQMIRLADAPKRIDVHLALSGGKTWGGVGEPGVAPYAPALCNAIFVATGKRIRRLPLKNVDLSWS